MTAPAEPSLDVSELYFNSMARLFENPYSPDSIRRLKRSDGLVQFLKARWVVSVAEIEGKDPPKAAPEPLWRLSPHRQEETDLVDLLVFLICDTGPDGSEWKISDNSRIRRLNDLEKEEIRDAVLEAADSWTLDFGRLNQGLDEILRLLARLLVSSGASTSGGHVFFTPARCEESLGRITKEISEFPLLSEDFSAVLDIGRCFELMMRFFLTLGTLEVPKSSRDVMKYARQLARRAHVLMTTFGIPGRRQHASEVRGVLDIIDGQLLPWACFFEVAVNDRGPREAFQVAWERYNISDSSTLPADVKRDFKLFKLEAEEVQQLPERAFYGAVRIAVMRNHHGPRCGAYSLLRALHLAEQLCTTLAPGKDRSLPPPLPPTQIVEKQDKLDLYDIREPA